MSEHLIESASSHHMLKLGRIGYQLSLHLRRRAHLPKKKKKSHKHRNEAERNTLKPFPSVKGFATWRYGVRTAVAAASGRGDEAMAWIREVEKEGATFESLHRTGSNYESLDQKLAAALAGMSHG